jgi:hypothetical protein
MRTQLSKIKKKLGQQGIRLEWEPGKPGHSLQLRTRWGEVLFTVGVDDIFDAHGNRFLVDL